MKITRNTTMEQLKTFIGANVIEVKQKDKNLFDRISYTDKQLRKDPKLVKKADLVTLAKDIMTLLGDSVHEVIDGKPMQVAVENSVKPALKSGSKKSSGKSEKSDSKAEVKTAEKTDSKVKKTAEKKPVAKKPPVPETVGADSFPDELTLGDETYTLAHDITGIDKLLESFNADEEILFAFYWSKAQIKQFNYGSGLLRAPKEGFENNLDLATTLYVSGNGSVCYNLSMYTEALYQVMPDAFEEIEGVRYSDGIEFQIYRKNS